MSNCPDWKCVCGYLNHGSFIRCIGCRAPRVYYLTQRQARVVARELNKGEEAQRMVAWHDRQRDIVLREHGLDEEFLYGCDTIDWLADRLVSARTERDGLSRMLAVATLSVARPHQKMPCGHERRFIVSGDDKDIDPYGKSDRGKTSRCALCELQGVRASNEALLDKMIISLREATDETPTT